MMQALGLIEVIGYPAAIEAADAALKAANVQLSELSKVGSGIMTVQLFGDVGAITAAVEAGERAAEKLGKVRSAHVIPRVDESLIGTVIKVQSAASLIKEDSEILASSVKEINQPIVEPADELNEETQEEQNASIIEETPKVNDQVVGLEDLSKKSNSELRKLIETLGINISDKKLKEAKKTELIRLITDSKK